MKNTTFQLVCADGVKLHAREWLPDSRQPAKAVVGIVHGMGEHIERYAHVARMLNEAGYAAVGFDQRGHGRTAGKRGHTPSYEGLLEGIELLLAHMARLSPGSPRFLFGHSMGGNLVLNYMLRRKPPLAGAIVGGPWLKLAFKPPALQTVLARFVEKLYPGYTNDRPLLADNLTSDPVMAEQMKQDGLRHGRITARFYLGVQRGGLWALRHAAELPVPTLLMHAEEDRVTSFQASRHFAERCGDMCEWREWPGFRHELHNDAGRERVFGVMRDWLDARCQGTL